MNNHYVKKWPFIVGTLFVLAALSLFLYNTYESKAASEQAEAALQYIHEVVPDQSTDGDGNGQAVPDYILNPNMEMPTVEIDGNRYIGTLYFPSLDVELPVMSSWSYPKLRKAPCLFTGSIYSGDAVVAAHNYSSHFGHLFNLYPGDLVYFTDVDGNVFTYEIVLQEILEPTAIEEMTSSGFDLSLFTCTYGGRTRFTVRCDLI